MPGARGASVFLETWYRLPDDVEDDLTSEAYWDQVLAVRTEVAREIEKARVAGAIGASLEAEVDLYVDAGLRAQLAKLGDELRFVLITSEARLRDLVASPQAGTETALNGLRVQVNSSTHAKCGRCWHRRADVGSYAEHPQLCGRCVNNAFGAGEARSFA
jgi:isoleucyl-tRNA synthetase